MLGTAIGSYRIVKKLGEGGMGAVYLAEHSLIGRQAAIKVLLPSLSARQDIVNRFFNEARAATAIADPGIVQIFDFGYHTDSSAYIVMEFLDGEALDVRLQRLGRLHPIDALRIARQLASSLASAHGKGIVHRDLKPENVFLVRDHEVAGGERVKILDFGIAKLSDDHPGKIKTNTGALMGTPVYMSPEQCRGAGDLDHRSDIYALGCVLFHLLVGRPPFDGDGVGDIIVMHLREPPPAPSSRAPGIPAEIDGVVLRCLAKAPDERYPNMTEVANALGGVLSYLAPGSVSSQHAVPAVPYHGAGATPLPGYGSRPPGAPSQPPTQIAPTPTPTTLGAGAGAMTMPTRPRSRGATVAILALLLAGGGGATFALSRGEDAVAVTPADGNPAVAIDAEAPVAPDAAIDTPDATAIDAGADPLAVTVDAGTVDAHGPDAAAKPDDSRRELHRRERRERRNSTNGRDPDDLDGDGIPDVR